MLASPHGRRSAGRLEQAVHAAVAAAGPDGIPVAEVTAAVDPSLAYTTVATTLARLADRGVLVRRRVGRSSVYAVLGDSSSVVSTSTARRMHRLLESAPDRSGALAQFVAGLSANDEARLAELLATVAADPAGPHDPGGTRG